MLGGRVKRGVGSNVSLLGVVGWTEVRVGLNVGIGSGGRVGGGTGGAVGTNREGG